MKVIDHEKVEKCQICENDVATILYSSIFYCKGCWYSKYADNPVIEIVKDNRGRKEGYIRSDKTFERLR